MKLDRECLNDGEKDRIAKFLTCTLDKLAMPIIEGQTIEYSFLTIDKFIQELLFEDKKQLQYYLDYIEALKIMKYDL